MSDEIHAWDELFALLAPVHDDVQTFARRIAGSNAEGDDVFQEAVLRAARKLSALRDRDRFGAWMCSVVVSVHRTRWRRSFWRRWISREPSRPEYEPTGDDGSHWADQRASARRATAALATLPLPQREAIVLFELQGYSIDEIAEIQKTSVSSVKSRLARGRDRLRRFYAALGRDANEAPTQLEEVCRG
jgi:RNA polymerase sigma-70 factor (ECF subfamily)